LEGPENLVLEDLPPRQPGADEAELRVAAVGLNRAEFRGDPNVLNTAKQYIYDRLQDGRLKPKIAKTFPLGQSREACEYLESNEQIGKVVITI
jgi:NADPH:quinone reductase-like Zn-dependent oxidoreductase